MYLGCMKESPRHRLPSTQWIRALSCAPSISLAFVTAGVMISNDVVLTGNSEDTYIFQVLSIPPGSNSAPIEV